MLVAGRSGNCGVKRFLYAVMAGLVPAISLRRAQYLP